jgi:hypothetical protein
MLEQFFEHGESFEDYDVRQRWAEGMVNKTNLKFVWAAFDSATVSSIPPILHIISHSVLRARDMGFSVHLSYYKYSQHTSIVLSVLRMCLASKRPTLMATLLSL